MGFAVALLPRGHWSAQRPLPSQNGELPMLRARPMAVRAETARNYSGYPALCNTATSSLNAFSRPRVAILGKRRRDRTAEHVVAHTTDRKHGSRFRECQCSGYRENAPLIRLNKRWRKTPVPSANLVPTPLVRRETGALSDTGTDPWPWSASCRAPVFRCGPKRYGAVGGATATAASDCRCSTSAGAKSLL